MARALFVSIASLAVVWISGVTSEVHRVESGVASRGVRGLSSTPSQMRIQQERHLLRK